MKSAKKMSDPLNLFGWNPPDTVKAETPKTAPDEQEIAKSNERKKQRRAATGRSSTVLNQESNLG